MSKATTGVPSLAHLLGETRADGYEEWVLSMTAIDATATTPQQALMARILRRMTVACLETLRQEHEAMGSGDVDTLTYLPRALGIAAMGAAMCMVKDGAERVIARYMSEEFQHGMELLIKAQGGGDHD